MIVHAPLVENDEMCVPAGWSNCSHEVNKRTIHSLIKIKLYLTFPKNNMTLVEISSYDNNYILPL